MKSNQNIMPRTKNYYWTLFSFVFGTLLLFVIFHFVRKKSHLDWLPYVSLSVGLLGILIPGVIVHLLNGIQYIQHKIGRLLTIVILSIVFFLLLTPIAWLSRLMTSKEGKDTTSIFKERNHTFSKEDLEKPW